MLVVYQDRSGWHWPAAASKNRAGATEPSGMQRGRDSRDTRDRGSPSSGPGNGSTDEEGRLVREQAAQRPRACHAGCVRSLESSSKNASPDGIQGVRNPFWSSRDSKVEKRKPLALLYELGQPGCLCSRLQRPARRGQTQSQRAGAQLIVQPGEVSFRKGKSSSKRM